MMTLKIKTDFAVSTVIFFWLLLICLVHGNSTDHQSLINVFVSISLVNIGFGSAGHSVEEKNGGT